MERFLTGGEDIRAVGAAGEYEHVEVVFAKDEPALVLNIESGIAEHPSYQDKFLVVDFKNVATLQRLTDDLLSIELLPQVDVENLQAIGGCTINLVKDNLYDAFIATAKEKYQAAYGKEPLVYDVVIGDGARKLI